MPINITAVQEHRIITSLEIDTIKNDDGEFTYIFATATKRYSLSYLTSEKISYRIIKAYFVGKPTVTIIAAYVPTKVTTADMKEEFYNNLLRGIESEPPHNVIIVLDDFNSRIRDDSHKTNPQVIRKSNYQDKTNDNGNRLVNMYQQTNLRQLQSCFPQPSRRQWTWKYPRGPKAQLDHILTNCRAYSSVKLGSDHRIVSASFKIRSRKFKRTLSGRKKYDWNKVIKNPEIRQQYQLERKSCFDVLNEVEHPETMHKDIVEIVGETAQKTIGNPPKHGPKNWVSDATIVYRNNPG